MNILISSGNNGKIAEIKAILDIPGVNWVTLDQVGKGFHVAETGLTFKENAVIKARAALERFDMPGLADDSGLEVDGLNGEPGVRSARYAGEQAGDAENMEKLLSRLAEKPGASRKARFVAATVLATEGERTISSTGVCYGRIALEPRGTGGFGYDPVFIPDGFERTMAELDPAEKNQISHRGKSLRALRAKVEAELEISS